MRKFLLPIIALLSLDASAQFESANWYFGMFAGITFNTNPPTALSGGQINQQEGCSSISDSAGNLLFYSDGQTVWDRTHSVMPNGTGLFGGVSSTQSSIAVQDPGNHSKYYLITAPQQDSNNPLAYSIIDMTLNGGNGDITATKNVPLLNGSTEKVTAVYHNNGTDVWIIGHEFGNNNFDAFLLTASGISATPVVSSVGSIHSNTSSSNNIGYLKASPCGNKLAAAVWFDDFLELFDFDNSTGVVSHAVRLGSWITSSGVYGVEFSPDNTKLYASIITPGIVVQYDLSAGSDTDIIKSQDTIGTSPVNFNGALQTGPDARIYLVKFGSNTLDVIASPNVEGTDCFYINDFVSFTGSGGLGLPTFFSSYFCNIIGVPQVESEQSISVFPNPAHDEIHLSVNNESLKQGFVLQVFNSIGQCVYYSEISSSASQTDIRVPLNEWSNGVYFLNASGKSGSFSQVFMRQ